MEQRLGSMAMSDDRFLRSFESLKYPAAEFRHLDHVRLAWIYLRQHEPEDAEQRMCTAIRAFAEANGAHRKYHETMTVAWMRLVAPAAAMCPQVDFACFLATHEWLAEKEVIFQFYSRERIGTEEAKRHFVAPDLMPLERWSVARQ